MRENTQKDEKEGDSLIAVKTFESDLGSNSACLVCPLVQVFRYFAFLHKMGNYRNRACGGKTRNWWFQDLLFLKGSRCSAPESLM